MSDQTQSIETPYEGGQGQNGPFAGQPYPPPVATATPPSNIGLPEADPEVSYEAAKAEATTPPQPAPSAEEEHKDTLDTLVPKSDPKLWVFGPSGEYRYVQKELSFIAKMQWFALVGDVIDRAMAGPTGVSVNSLFEVPQGRGGTFTLEDFRDADTFIRAAGKILSVAPDFLVKSYCIWLNVPDYERELVASIMKLPSDEGGLSDEQGIEIIEVFIDQNFEALRRFFTELLAKVRDRAQARMEAPKK